MRALKLVIIAGVFVVVLTGGLIGRLVTLTRTAVGQFTMESLSGHSLTAADWFVSGNERPPA